VNAPLRRVGVVVLILFGLLFANLNWVQAYKADDYRTNPHNGRVQVSEYERQRGTIAVGKDGKAVAISIETTGNLTFLRTYPLGPQYAHVVGYKPVNLQATNIELAEDDFLSGASDDFNRLTEMFTGEKKPGGNINLTLLPGAQQTAYNELLDNRVGAKAGAVVALDPKTGAILSLVSTPSFDPNKLASHDFQAAQAAYDKLDKDPNKPLINRALKETFPPGSTFKVIVSAAALEAGRTPETLIPAGPVYNLPGTANAQIKNAAPSICPGAQVTLIDALTESCNTGYAQLGVTLGGDAVITAARNFGFGSSYTLAGDGNRAMTSASSETGTMQGPNGYDPAQVAQSSIGQRDVRMTPLQGALVAASVANGGTQMRPYLIQSLQKADLTTTFTAEPKALRQACPGPVANDLQRMMISVVENGTGTKAQISGFQVGGKTGTAQNEITNDHGWFIGFAMKNGEPIAAIAVLLESAGAGGSSEAARIAGQVLRAIIAERGLN
jgi:peptidoglycan glycosyltransferase